MRTLKDALKLPALIEWLQAQEPTGFYPYGSSRTCLVAQYLRESVDFGKGQRFMGVSPTDIYVANAEYADGYMFSEYPEVFDRIAYGGGEYADRTYSGALQRAMAELANAEHAAALADAAT